MNRFQIETSVVDKLGKNLVVRICSITNIISLEGGRNRYIKVLDLVTTDMFSPGTFFCITISFAIVIVATVVVVISPVFLFPTPTIAGISGITGFSGIVTGNFLI